jgi:hypothetical protein
MNCPYCSQTHSGICWRVKSVEYFENGTIRKVEFRDFSQHEPVCVPSVFIPGVIPQYTTTTVCQGSTV